VDEDVKNGIVKPGQYLILEFDFSCVARSRNIGESMEFLRSAINDALEEFKLEYINHLGQSFASATSDFKENNPAGNLNVLVNAVSRELRHIRERGEKDHPLWGVQGVCLFQIIIHRYTF